MTVILLVGLVALAVVSLVVSNFLWLRHFRYLTNLAVSKTPTEFATLQVASKATIKDKDKPKRIRPEGI